MNLKQGEKAIGTIVHVSDGTPRPPERFNRKLAAWEGRNYSGILTEVKPSWDNSYITRSIMTKKYSYAVFNQSGDLAVVEAGEHPEAAAHETVK